MMKKSKFFAVCAAVVGFAFAFVACNFFNNEDESSSSGGSSSGDNLSAGFVEISGAHFDGASTLTPSSDVFRKGRVIDIKDLYVSDHETTQAEYEKYCNYGGSETSRPDDTYGKGNNYPVYWVSYYDALVYCNLRSEAEGFAPCYSMNDDTDVSKWTDIVSSGGKYCGPATESRSQDDPWNLITCNFNANGYRLPTEAEWEYLARSDGQNSLTTYKYSGSDVVDEVAWYLENSQNKVQEVKMKNSNAAGLYDMSGNVREWCYDWYGTITASSDETGASSGTARVSRGGSVANTFKYYCEVNFRSSTSPYLRHPDLGFRVVRTAK